MPKLTLAAAGFILCGFGVSAQTISSDKPRMQRIEANVVDVPMGQDEPPLRAGLKDVMRRFHVPGLSVAIIDNFRIAWLESYGVLATGSGMPVTPTTLFQAGSISKPVAAVGALYLVEQGKLALDEEVNAKLKSWKVPENEFTKEQKVTLRRLMSHTAGLTVHGFPGYDVSAPMPTLVQIFNGEKPANTSPIRVDLVPGTKFRYSGGGVTIEQQLMMDVTGKAFPELLRETVLDKLGMANSSYEQPLPPARAAMTATGTHSSGKPVQGRWRLYPEMAAAGLWTTPQDLAKFAIEIALAKQGKSSRVLSQKMTNEMLTPVLDGVGLGFFIDRENPGQFGHNGADEGFQALLTMNYETGQGAVIMANSDNGIAVADLLLRSIAKEYEWKYKATARAAGAVVWVVCEGSGLDAALERYAELRKLGDGPAGVNERTLNTLGYQLLYSGQEQDAIKAFTRNVQEYPKSANVYDSLGEAYAKTGQKDLAIRNYEKAVELDPKNPSSAEALKKLKGGQ